ncbi:MAG: DUF485 domain-containing protein [Planctomycetota bacterium]
MNTAPSSPARQFNAKLGMILFVIYLLLYVGFVLINAFKADWMERVVLAGLNLAIVYGFALIVVALMLAGIYGVLCRTDPVGTEDHAAGEESGT